MGVLVLVAVAGTLVDVFMADGVAVGLGVLVLVAVARALVGVFVGV